MTDKEYLNSSGTGFPLPGKRFAGLVWIWDPEERPSDGTRIEVEMDVQFGATTWRRHYEGTGFMRWRVMWVYCAPKRRVRTWKPNPAGSSA